LVLLLLLIDLIHPVPARPKMEPWSSAAIPPEEPLVAESRSSERSRLDDYRLELQRLQDEAEEAQKPVRLIKALARVVLKEPLFKRNGRYHRQIHQDDHLLQKKEFKPYQLRFRKQEGNNGRPVILHFIGNTTVGGLSRLVIDIVEWSSDRYEHVICTLHNPTPPAYVGVKIIECGLKTSVPEFIRTIAGYKPVLIHVHHYAPHHLYDAWQWYRNCTMAAGEMAVPMIQGVNVPMTPYCHPSVSKYVFVSHYVRERFGFNACANEVIYPGSDFSFFAARAHTFSDTIGMVYRLDESKLRKESIDVFIRVLQLRPTAKALIVGDGYLLAHFKESVQKAGLTDRFTFTGYLAYEKLPEFYNRMDVFVAPVFCESFGQVTPFAMNMGIPVVAYETGALPEILDDPSVIAPAGNADALAKIIIDLLASEQRYRETALRQQARAAAHFTVEQMAAEYSKLYERLLSQKPMAQTTNGKANE